MHKIRVPSLAENVNEAAVGSWLVGEGEHVTEKGELVELLTEKAEFTLESDYAGIVTAILAPPKSVMPVGSILCVIDGTEDDAVAADAENNLVVRKHSAAPTVEMRRPVEFSRPGSDVRATPAARRLAKENGISLSEVAQRLGVTGPVKEEHIREFLES